MRRSLIVASLFLSTFAAAAPSAPSTDFVVVMHVAVEVKGAASSSIMGATMSRDWLTSWSSRASERREVTLQPVDKDGKPGSPTTYRGCSLAGVSGLQGNSNVVGSVRLSCEEQAAGR